MNRISETKRWLTASPITPGAFNALQGYPPVLQQILFNRGYGEREKARAYLEARQLPGTDPQNLTGIPAAVQRVLWARDKQESVAIYGDYDADGVTATALLQLYLQSFGIDARGYIPNRFDEGYGLNIEALDSLKSEGVSLVITVDCGIRSLKEARHAAEIGLDLIISDHHHVGSELPEAIAIVNPKQPGDTYPEKDLAGVGLAYKLAEALDAAQGGTEAVHQDYLDLVALGTIADLAPLVGENRFLVRQGLYQIRRPQRQGILSLIGVAGLKREAISATDIGFALGPRINAAGRLDSAYDALELLTTQDVGRSAFLAQKLEFQNRERQQITRKIQEHAEETALSENPGALLLFAAHPDYNPGVVGLAASRLTDRFYRPAIVAFIDEEFTRASCRSISEFHITKALDQCADLLEYYGGHAAAAGFTIRNEHLPELKDRLQILANEHLSDVDLRPTLSADVEIPLSDLKPEILDYLEWLEPTGYGNRQPLFTSRDLLVNKSRTVGKDGSHLKMTVSDGHITFDAIAFRQGHWQAQMPTRVDLMYNFEVNEFRGQKTLQLNVKDLKPTGADD